MKAMFERAKGTYMISSTRRKIRFWAVGLLSIGLATSGLFLAPTAEAAGSTYPVKETVNIRSGASTSYAIVGSATGGSSQSFDCYALGASIYGDTVWGHLANGQGYISDFYISVGGKTLAQAGLPACGSDSSSGSGSTTSTPAAPTPTTPAEPAPATPAPTAPASTGSTASSGKVWTYSVKETVNIRSGASTGYAIVGSATGGSSQSFDCYALGASISGDTVWGHLANGQGYISDFYISIGGNTLAQTGAPACSGSATSSSSTSSSSTSSGSTSSTTMSDMSAKLIAAAQALVAQQIPYVWGGGHQADPAPSTGIPEPISEAGSAEAAAADWAHDSVTPGLDCSGFVRVVYYNALGVDLGGGFTSAMASSRWVQVSAANAVAGDVVEYSGHIAIYDGNGRLYGESDHDVPTTWGYAIYGHSATAMPILGYFHFVG